MVIFDKDFVDIRPVLCIKQTRKIAHVKKPFSIDICHLIRYSFPKKPPSNQYSHFKALHIPVTK